MKLFLALFVFCWCIPYQPLAQAGNERVWEVYGFAGLAQLHGYEKSYSSDLMKGTLWKTGAGISLNSKKIIHGILFNYSQGNTSLQKNAGITANTSMTSIDLNLAFRIFSSANESLSGYAGASMGVLYSARDYRPFVNVSRSYEWMIPFRGLFIVSYHFKSLPLSLENELAIALAAGFAQPAFSVNPALSQSANWKISSFNEIREINNRTSVAFEINAKHSLAILAQCQAYRLLTEREVRQLMYGIGLQYKLML